MDVIKKEEKFEAVAKYRLAGCLASGWEVVEEVADEYSAKHEAERLNHATAPAKGCLRSGQLGKWPIVHYPDGWAWNYNARCPECGTPLVAAFGAYAKHP